MLPYEIFFYGGMSFLAGVFMASVGVAPFFITIGVFVVSGALLLVRMRGNARCGWYAALLLFAIVGSLLFRLDEARFRAPFVPFGEKRVFTGVVVSDPVVSDGTQEMKLLLDAPASVQVLLTMRAYPQLRYGDAVRMEGVISRIAESGYAHYLTKERVRGLMRYPKVTVTAHGYGSAVKAALLELKRGIVSTFRAVLPPEEATFLSGLTIGARGSFSAELKQAMQKSGTTHLVALSGYNITILVSIAMSVLLLLFSRRISFVLAMLILAAFVVMTGAEASVVRAAILGFLVLFARDRGRAHDLRNIIVGTAITMVLINPKVLVFDAGFQLSFLAFIGIVYVRPALLAIFGIREDEKSLFSWKENSITTGAAQLATLPVLIMNFGMVSPVSLLSNIAIAEFIPTTMALGFFTAAVSCFSSSLAFVFGLIASMLLKVELFLIYFFARISFPVSLKVGVAMVFVYYTTLGLFVWRYTYYRDRRTV